MPLHFIVNIVSVLGLEMNPFREVVMWSGVYEAVPDSVNKAHSHLY